MRQSPDPRQAARSSAASAGPAADSSPGKPGEELLGGLLGYGAVGAEPVPGADLSHADQRHAEQVCLVVAEARVLADELADHVGAGAHGAVQPGPHLRLVAQVGLEYQPERFAGAAYEVEERLEGGGHALPVVGGRGKRLTHAPDELLHALVEQREIEVQVAGEVLIEHGLADAGSLGDLVHGCGVVTLGDEYLLSRPEQLPASCGARQPRTGRAVRSGLRRCGHEGLRMFCCHCWVNASGFILLSGSHPHRDRGHVLVRPRLPHRPPAAPRVVAGTALTRIRRGRRPGSAQRNQPPAARDPCHSCAAPPCLIGRSNVSPRRSIQTTLVVSGPGLMGYAGSMRSMWKGAISFGLVMIPVKLYAATEQKDIAFRQVHRTDGGRIRFRRVCSVCGEEVPYEDVAKGYELPTGEMVVLTDEDLAELPLPTARSIEVVHFMPAEQLDPILLNRSYFVEPESAGARAYVLLRDSLDRSGKVALTLVALRQRESLATLRTP